MYTFMEIIFWSEDNLMMGVGVRYDNKVNKKIGQLHTWPDKIYSINAARNPRTACSGSAGRSHSLCHPPG